MTGTPVGSDIQDLKGQFNFLRMQPFTNKNFFARYVKPSYSGSSWARAPAGVLLYMLSQCMIRHTKLQVGALDDPGRFCCDPPCIASILLYVLSQYMFCHTSFTDKHAQCCAAQRLDNDAKSSSVSSVADPPWLATCGIMCFMARS